ncbi:MAG: DUF167 domain-containing protein [Acidimicrobiales bacterium]
MVDDLFQLEDDAVVLSVHAQPGAGRTQITGRQGAALKIRVAVPPEHGRANDALTDVLAEEFGVSASKVELVSGERSRAKRFRITGVDPDVFERTLGDLVDASRKPTDRPEGRRRRP